MTGELRCSCGVWGIPPKANYCPMCGGRLFAKDQAQSGWEWLGVTLDETEDQFDWSVVVARALLAEIQRLGNYFGDYDQGIFRFGQRLWLAFDGQEYELHLNYPAMFESRFAVEHSAQGETGDRPIVVPARIDVYQRSDEDKTVLTSQEQLDFEQLQQRFSSEVIRQWASGLYGLMAYRAFYISLGNFVSP